MFKCLVYKKHFNLFVFVGILILIQAKIKKLNLVYAVDFDINLDNITIALPFGVHS